MAILQVSTNLARPTSSGSPHAPTPPEMICASQAMRRAMSALIGPPSASDAEPIQPCSTGRLTGYYDLGVFAALGGSSPLPNPRWARSTRASASRLDVRA